jgi:polysaccharide export outer membrane protein
MTLAAALVLGSGLTVGATQQVEAKIAPRDQLTVNVLGVAELSGKFLVDVDGTFEFPNVGRLQAGGRTPRELAKDISDSIVEKALMITAPQVIVDLEQTANKRVTVTGAVRVPSEIVYAGQMRLFDALVRVGMTGPGAADEVLVVRPSTDTDGEDTIMRVNLRELTGGNLAQYDLALQDGDRVIVPEAESVFIDGHVRSPGMYVVPSGSTVRQALTLAGGITDKGSDKGIRILRREPGEQEPKELKNVDLDELVRPGDTIIIRKRIL